MRILLLCALLFSRMPAIGQLERFNYEGDNPGELSFFRYVPPAALNNPDVPLVIVLHGCGQDARQINALAGWTALADELGLLLLFPEQKKLNNMGDCFNWFLANDVEPFGGEMHSIYIATQAFRREYSGTRNYVYGVSAGAAMALAMLYNYPDFFRAGAVLAGGAFKYHDSMLSAATYLQQSNTYPAEIMLGFLPERIRRYSGPFPSLVSIHGTSDPVVHVAHQEGLRKQYLAWTRSETAEEEASAPRDGIRRRQFSLNEAKTEQLVLYTLEGMGHAVPVDHSQPERKGGSGLFAASVDWFSTRAILVDWGLTQ